jgi:phosphatidylglycerophosphate synthase
MAESVPLTSTRPADPRPLDAQLARKLVTPLKDTWVTPNHLTTVRLAVGLVATAAFAPGTYIWSNLGALLLALSNFLDHADGELARISGKSSRIGHLYDLASDALVTVLLFVAIGIGVSATTGRAGLGLNAPPVELGSVAGIAVAIIFFLRMRIESMAGKAGTRQAILAGFETEDVLYLLPLVTVCNGLVSFLTLASIGAPLFAIWVTIDYRRALNRHQPFGETTSIGALETEADALLATRLVGLDLQRIQREFVGQGAFLSLQDFAGSDVTQRLVAAARSAMSEINRNYIPRHKQGGSVSRHSLDQLAPFVGDLYRSSKLIEWLSEVVGERLQPAPAEDAHAYAFYFYTDPGDHIGWHYDTSYYAGRRYTVLLGVIDQSSCRLEYELHTRERGVSIERESLQIAPGGLVLFDGDRLRHRITPLGRQEIRISLTLEYVTDTTMHPWWRFVSKMKDAIAYFGFRQVFRRVSGRIS